MKYLLILLILTLTACHPKKELKPTYNMVPRGTHIFVIDGGVRCVAIVSDTGKAITCDWMNYYEPTQSLP